MGEGHGVSGYDPGTTSVRSQYSQYPLMYHPDTHTAMQEKVGYKRPRRDQK